ncbi:MAG: hypothetical protein IPJ30_12625 [Acidobacteria bacterium]|nr:hypothetical protein [Acidobacteriota bacterium]
MSPSIVQIVIPELVLNMKRHSPRHGDRGFQILFEGTRLTFRNRFSLNERPAADHSDSGLEMCERIVLHAKVQMAQRRADGFFEIWLELDNSGGAYE